MLPLGLYKRSPRGVEYSILIPFMAGEERTTVALSDCSLDEWRTL
jgi:hypothetical protein